ncbi:MAG: polyprenyl diphosphate synthase [Archaeoglobaceae archaeon]|nr:polyprenyl diphosphate synthase [Archaeoglobaceae archaeon]MCX8152618.1 polyprenyl diphosphate synthase [Archaeoglobaceae archaeon]MDW8014100.1 polyprenyl diphosphate synthase [Archaeoglobaceae archaeon]
MIRKLYEILLFRKVKSGLIPKHIAIIMDGNRRFASRKGLPPYFGHFFGSKKVEEVVKWCWELGVKMLTLYAFSTENFRRSEEEKRNLFSLMEKEFKRVLNDKKIYEEKVRVKVVGRVDMLPESLQKLIRDAEERTKDHDNYFLNVAIAYGGRQELVDAARKILKKVKEGKISPEKIDEKVVEENLYSDGYYSRVDIVIRTGGEQRLSNFLPWQSANSFVYFCDIYWPSFRKIDFLRAIRSWQQRLNIYKA